MKKMKMRWSGLILLTLIMVLAGSLTTQAASSAWNKACKKYKTFLSKYESSYDMDHAYGGSPANTEGYKKTALFMIMDMDQDGVPELIAVHNNSFGSRTVYIYTYKNNKVKKLGGAKMDILTYTNGGGFSAYKCQKNHLHVHAPHGMGYCEDTYLVKNGKVKHYAHDDVNTRMDYSNPMHSYSVNGKPATADKYQKAVGSCQDTGNFTVNNASNRSIYVK